MEYHPLLFLVGLSSERACCHMQVLPPQEEAAVADEQLKASDDIATPREDARELEGKDDFGIAYNTEYQVIEYENWNQTRIVTITYGEMDLDDRAAVRKLQNYESPTRAGGSLASRRQDALRGVVDDAQVSLERGEGWDDEDAAAEGGLLEQFEGEMLGDGDGDEISLSDGVGTNEPQQQDLGDSAVGLMEDDEDMPTGLDGIDDESADVVAVKDDDLEEVSGEADDDMQENSADLLDDEVLPVITVHRTGPHLHSVAHHDINGLSMRDRAMQFCC